MAAKRMPRRAPAPDRAELKRALGVTIDGALLEQALTHLSYANEEGGLPTSEPLEFLGDPVLALAVTEMLYESHDLSARQRRRVRDTVVSAQTLAKVARGIGLGAHIRLGRGEDSTSGRDNASTLANTLKALIGAVHWDRGPTVADELVALLFSDHMDELINGLIDYSGSAGPWLGWTTPLQELTAREGLGVPKYRTTEGGPDHPKTFQATVTVDGITYGPGKEGPSKKLARQFVAEVAFRAISDQLAREHTDPDPAADGEIGPGANGKADGPGTPSLLGRQTEAAPPGAATSMSVIPRRQAALPWEVTAREPSGRLR
jgi:ribonuclease-3